MPSYAEEVILTKNSESAVSRIRKVLLPASGEVETFDGIPMADGGLTGLTIPPSPSQQVRTSTAINRSASGSASGTQLGGLPSSAAAAAAGKAVKVTLSDFEILAVIGRGGYGKVFQVRRKGSTEIYAMKCLKKKDIIARKQASRTMVERNILSTIDHPFIVNLKYAFQVWTVCLPHHSCKLSMCLQCFSSDLPEAVHGDGLCEWWRFLLDAVA